MPDHGVGKSPVRARIAMGAAAFVLLSTTVLGGVGGDSTRARMTGSATTGSSFASGTIFPGVRSVATWDLTDASNGTAADHSDPLSFPSDSLIEATGNFATAFAATRYMQWDYNDSIAAGLPVSSASFNVRVIPNATAQTACWYIEVRRASTNALLGTHGTTDTPYACVTGTTYTTVTVPLAEVTTTDVADDLRIKLFASETGAKRIRIDLATVTGATAYGAFTLYETTEADASTGTAAVTPWPLAMVDADAYTDAANWTTTFVATRYLLFHFDSGVPAGAVVTAATLTSVYQSSTAASSCYYFEVYSGATLLGIHGSAVTPISCATNAAWVTDTVTLAEVNSVARANDVLVKMYFRSSSSRKTRHDTVALNLTYSRP